MAWIKKNIRDAAEGIDTPIPTQIVSNEEFTPLPQTPDQAKVEARIDELAAHYSAKLDVNRRDFMRSTGGMAAAFMAMNEVFGPAFKVAEAEVVDSQAHAEMWPKNEFIFDAQTHHVKDSISGPLMFRKMTGKAGLNPDLDGIVEGKDTLHRANFVKEIFFDSDTVMAIMTGAVIGPPKVHALPADEMVKTRNLVNQAAGSKRMLSHGLANPVAENWQEDFDWQVNELKIDGWKAYTGNPTGTWRLDDEKVAYPFFERMQTAGITNISIHKGLPLPGRFEPFFKIDDIRQAAKDFPDINFIIYHSGMKNMMTMLPPGENGIDPNGYIPWTTDLVRMREENPWMTNVYPELGAVFGHSVITHPDVAGHLLGQLIGAFGADHVIWGTDAIWWGSPQWMIEAFRRFQISEALQAQYGYKPISDADKSLIFGPNLAGLYDIDVNAARTAIPGDSLSSMKTAYLKDGGDASNTAYGWVAV